MSEVNICLCCGDTEGKQRNGWMGWETGAAEHKQSFMLHTSGEYWERNDGVLWLLSFPSWPVLSKHLLMKELTELRVSTLLWSHCPRCSLRSVNSFFPYLRPSVVTFLLLKPTFTDKWHNKDKVAFERTDKVLHCNDTYREIPLESYIFRINDITLCNGALMSQKCSSL